MKSARLSPLVVLTLLALSACQTSRSVQPATTAPDNEATGAATNSSLDNSAATSSSTNSTANSNSGSSTGTTTNSGSTANSTNAANNNQVNFEPDQGLAALLNAEAFQPSSATRTGALEDVALTEVSGLAASQRYPSTLWAINDSGNSAELFAFNQQGASLGRFTIAAENRDWEDLAAATINGEPYILIADIGDNLTVKTTNTVHVIAEPLLNEPDAGALQPIHTLSFRYPGEPHNAEGLAYADGYVYILTKEGLVNGNRQASQAFRVPLDFNDGQTVQVAESIASLAMPSGSLETTLAATIGGVDLNQPTAFEIDQQNRYAYVLTYRNVFRYERAPEQTWGEALAGPLNNVHSHSLSQSEALAITSEGVIWFTSEKRPAPLWALPAADY